jgi:DNA gyrase subunit A
MLMSSSGTLVRTRASEISILGRNTQGVRLIRLDDGERLIGVEPVEPENGENGEGDEASGEDAVGGAGEAAEPPSPA